MKLYGKEPEQLSNAASLFMFVLSDFPIEKINEAFIYHLQHSSEMPTPADIANVIRRGNRPPLDKTVYISLSKTDPCNRTREEWAYMREYEDFLIHG